MEEISFMNLVFRGLSREVLLRDSPEMKIVVTVNAEFVVLANEDDIFKKIICDNYSTLDGQIPFALARWKFPGRRIEKISGSDFIYDICLNAKQFDRKVFLLGGYPASNRRAVSVIRDRYGITVEGFSPEYQPYPFSEMHNRTILDYIEKFRPHFLLVGFGARKQELWINENKIFLETIGVKMAVGVGGTFEFVSNTIKRAPRLIQDMGMEGLYRLLREPNLNRLKRILISLKIFKYYFR
jgi:N-acetylglucosaminyldiphosphoundecaprenol N-acetyl-beta-D-mannosaminyltransferase